MKNKIYLLLIVFLSIMSIDRAIAQAWTQRANFTGSARHAGSGFVVGDKAYVGLGTNDAVFYKDFYMWNQSTDTWTKVANYPGASRREAVAFAVGKKGYVGTGCCGAKSDFWCYDTDSNKWTAIAPYPFPVMTGVAFAIGNKGYVGLGDAGGATFSKKFYEYSVDSNKWKALSNFPGAGRTDALGFSMNGKGYVAIGDDGTLPMLKDFWEYEPSTDTWTKMADFPGGARTTATGFAIDSVKKVYLGTGDDDSQLYADVWAWDGDTASATFNTWTQIPDFPGGVRTDETGFAIGSKGYIAVGSLGGFPNFNDLWEWDPFAVVSIQENRFSSDFSAFIYPNPVQSNATIKILNNKEDGDFNLLIVDVFGKKFHEQILSSTMETLNFNLASGIYFYKITGAKNEIANGKFIVK